MNILLFVTSMIMVMAMLTYARIETYRSFSLLQAEFKHYMDNTERAYINKAAEDWYNTSRGEKKEDQGKTKEDQGKTKDDDEKKEKSKANRRLSFAVFVDKSKKEKYAKEYSKIYLMSKKLIYTLFKDQPFFKEIEQKRPDIVDALLNSLMVAAESQPANNKPKNSQDLANLNLGDEELNMIFYHILQETIKRPEKKSEAENKQISATEDDKGESDDEETLSSDNWKEYRSPEGVYSLLDYITLSDGPKVRVYLAPKRLLSVIFDDPAVVKAVIESRKDLFKKVKNKTMTNDQASEAFKGQFASLSDPNFDDTILDFTVSKTDPKRYGPD